MSKKRKFSDSGVEQQMNGGSDSFPQDGDVKRARLGSWSETTMEDLPSELIESILIKAIVMEVKGLKLANSVWKDKADLVISRLCTVCSHWSNILTTNFFRNELHRTLASAQETIRSEILHQSQIQNFVIAMVTLKDEIFLLVRPELQGLQFDVYDRNNMAVVKDVIPLRRVGLRSDKMAACSVSNCLYMLNEKFQIDHFSVLRISRDNQNLFTVETFIDDVDLPQGDICVSPDGNLILLRKQSKRIDAVTVCDANGNVQHTVRLPIDMNWLDRIFARSNGNLVLVQAYDQDKAKLTEVSMNGAIIRQYQSSISMYSGAIDVDHNRRMLLCDMDSGMELLDCELNIINFPNVQLIGSQYIFLHLLSYNMDRNEMVAIATDLDSENSLLTIFQLS